MDIVANLFLWSKKPVLLLNTESLTSIRQLPHPNFSVGFFIEEKFFVEFF
jgi:hypothetical protein